jgi:50S ribosomal protein L16 3-hydroxylase
VARFLGEYLTEPKAHVVFTPGRAARARRGAGVRLDPKTQLLYYGKRFFMNGEAIAVARGEQAALRALADRRRLPANRLAPLGALIRQWQRSGYLEWETP